MPFALIEQRQNTKKLESSFLRCLKYFAIGSGLSNQIPSALNNNYSGILRRIINDKRHDTITPCELSILDDRPFTENWIITDSNLKKKIEYNRSDEAIQKDAEILIIATAEIISSRKLDRYFDGEVRKIEESILADSKKMNFFAKKKESDWWRDFYQEVYSKNIDCLTPEDFLDEYISHLRGLLRYLCKGISADGKKRFSELLLFGGINLPVFREIVYTQEQAKNYEKSIKNYSSDKEENLIQRKHILEKEKKQ